MTEGGGDVHDDSTLFDTFLVGKVYAYRQCCGPQFFFHRRLLTIVAAVLFLSDIFYVPLTTTLSPASKHWRSNQIARRLRQSLFINMV
jgi:hypothetical protein